jgi:hypothetical protein
VDALDSKLAPGAKPPMLALPEPGPGPLVLASDDMSLSDQAPDSLTSYEARKMDFFNTISKRPIEILPILKPSQRKVTSLGLAAPRRSRRVPGSRNGIQHARLG